MCVCISVALFVRSRRPADTIVLDESCTAEFEPDPHCLASRIRRESYPFLPRCWNFNETVVAGMPCRAPRNGAPLGACLELGFSQTAYIVECGGRYKNDAHCGTFLEIHRKGLPACAAMRAAMDFKLRLCCVVR
jgi:hypothetical protein